MHSGQILDRSVQNFDKDRAEKNRSKVITTSKSYALAAPRLRYATRAASTKPADDDVAEYTLLRKQLLAKT